MSFESDEHQRAKRILFTDTDAWRVWRIVSEFVEGFERMMDLGPSVAIFGSARLKETHPYYELASTVAKHLAGRGFAIITGGGPGIMEAANKGAQAVRGRSCGIAIDLPFELEPNSFIDPKYCMEFRYFFVRKVMFIRYAQGYVFLPGGVGSLDELFEALTLIQTKKIHGFPIYLMGAPYWTGLIDWLKNTVMKEGCISEKDLDLFHITDDPEEVADGIERHYRIHQSQRNF